MRLTIKEWEFSRFLNEITIKYLNTEYFIIYVHLKLNYSKKVFYFTLNFLPWEFLLIKKLDFEKTKFT
jgi:hypothetical protein